MREKREDPYRPDPPNQLYFGTFKPFTDKDCVRFYWVLKDKDGRQLASSNNLWPEKIDAIRNAISVFGKEIWAGHHMVAGESDYNLVLKEGLRIEAEVKKERE